MSLLPFMSLGIAVAFATLAWRRRRGFQGKPYFHWFLYLHLTAIGLHQFEEYGWPGGFRDAFAAVFRSASAAAVVPPATSLEILNVFGLTTAFALAGWAGTRATWVGLAALFVNFGNGFFHLVASVTTLTYVPGVVTGTLIYLPLGLLATRHAVLHRDVSAPKLLLAFAAGVIISFAPFLQVWSAAAMAHP